MRIEVQSSPGYHLGRDGQHWRKCVAHEIPGQGVRHCPKFDAAFGGLARGQHINVPIMANTGGKTIARNHGVASVSEPDEEMGLYEVRGEKGRSVFYRSWDGVAVPWRERRNAADIDKLKRKWAQRFEHPDMFNHDLRQALADREEEAIQAEIEERMKREEEKAKKAGLEPIESFDERRQAIFEKMQVLAYVAMNEGKSKADRVNGVKLRGINIDVYRQTSAEASLFWEKNMPKQFAPIPASVARLSGSVQPSTQQAATARERFLSECIYYAQTENLTPEGAVQKAAFRRGMGEYRHSRARRGFFPEYKYRRYEE